MTADMVRETDSGFQQHVKCALTVFTPGFLKWTLRFLNLDMQTGVSA